MTEKKTRLPGELTFTLLLLLGSLFLLAQAHGISGFESITSAGMFPMLSAVVMVVAIFSVLSAVLGAAPVQPKDGEPLAQGFIRRITPPVFLSFVLAVAAFMLLLPKLGFMVSASVFLLIGMRLLGSTRWFFNALVSGVCLAAVYVIFQTAFSVVLPKGTWLLGL